MGEAFIVRKGGVGGIDATFANIPEKQAQL